MKKKQYLNESINHQFSSINYSNYQFLSNPGHGGKKEHDKMHETKQKKNEIKRNKRKRSHNYFAYLVIIVIKKKKNDRVKSLHIGHHRLACTCAINQKQLADQNSPDSRDPGTSSSLISRWDQVNNGLLLSRLTTHKP